ncbi:MAG TPA: MFS transporter [Planctomycetota bacterium]|nr:MFS transporter [Planctomycetota bacterium]
MTALSRRAAFLALGVIFAANFLSYLDRTLVSALEEPLKGAFGLDSANFGLLWTLFTIGYMVCAIPIGYLADRFHRPRILALCIVVWSVATIGSGWAISRETLFACRLLIGVGEAGCLIIGQALIADYFARESRGRALSVFHFAVPLGGTGAFIMAGALGKVLDWRELFYIAGAPGFLVAALILLLIDPPRGGEGEPAAPRTNLGGYFQLFRIRSLMFVIFGQAFAVILLVCWIHFGVEFFTEVRGMNRESARITLGILALISGALGNTVGGILGDRLARKYRGAYAFLAGTAYLVAVPFLLVGFLSADRWVFLPTLTIGSFCLFLCMPAVNAQIAAVTPAHQRAMAWSMAVFILHLLGDTAAPWVFGKVDLRFGRTHAFTGFTFFLVLAGICCFLAARSARGDLERLEAAKGESPPAHPV